MKWWQVVELKQIDDTSWEIPQSGDMKVPGRVFTSAEMLNYATL